MPHIPTESAPTELEQIIVQAITAAGGWLPFDRFMALALYAPGLGYYAGAAPKFGLLPDSGSDFVTAPELSPAFGQTLAVQVAEALEQTGTQELWEFGAGSGALALQLLDALDALGVRVQRYHIVELSASLRARQQALLARHAHKLQWHDTLPERFEGVVLGNEVLDAMPVKLLQRTGGVWHERGVGWEKDSAAARFVWRD
ncbi:MAG: SAM-dependent methyltransferase, partial [Burkholderiaceae bacterium]